MVGHLKRVLLMATILLLCVSALGGCIDYESGAEGTSGTGTESAEETTTAEETATLTATGTSNTPSEAETDGQGYYNEAEDGVSKRY